MLTESQYWFHWYIALLYHSAMAILMCADFYDLGKFIYTHTPTHTHTHTHTTILQPSWILSGTTRVSRLQKGKTRKVNQSGFTGARDSEWQWHQLGHVQICTSPQTDTMPTSHNSVFTDQMPFCHPTNSIKALKAKTSKIHIHNLLICVMKWHI